MKGYGIELRGGEVRKGRKLVEAATISAKQHKTSQQLEKIGRCER